MKLLRIIPRQPLLWLGSLLFSVPLANAQLNSVPPNPQAVLQDTSCQHSYLVSSLLKHAGQYALAYDTSKSFVERCPMDPHAPGAFGDMAGDVAYGGNGPFPAALIDFRQWLLSALAWNPHSRYYFCSDVGAIMQTFGNGDTSWTGRNLALNQGLSVLYWAIHNPLCYGASDSELYMSSRSEQIGTWRRTQDTTKVKLDTTIYSLHDLGLDSVLKYAAMLGVHDANLPSLISNAVASPNPMGEGTVISFGTSREAFVKIEVFDLLGNIVAQGFESVLEQGNHSVPISLHNLPSGTYYARIMTTYGEVQTVKLQKE